MHSNFRRTDEAKDRRDTLGRADCGIEHRVIGIECTYSAYSKLFIARGNDAFVHKWDCPGIKCRAKRLPNIYRYAHCSMCSSGTMKGIGGSLSRDLLLWHKYLLCCGASWTLHSNDVSVLYLGYTNTRAQARTWDTVRRSHEIYCVRAYLGSVYRISNIHFIAVLFYACMKHMDVRLGGRQCNFFICSFSPSSSLAIFVWHLEFEHWNIDMCVCRVQSTWTVATHRLRAFVRVCAWTKR